MHRNRSGRHTRRSSTLRGGTGPNDTSTEITGGGPTGTHSALRRRDLPASTSIRPGAVDALEPMTAGDVGIDDDQASQFVDLVGAYRRPELASTSLRACQERGRLTLCFVLRPVKE